MAFTLVEILMAMAIMVTVFVSLYAGINSGVQVIRVSRENLRATQILVEHTEIARLCTWTQVNDGVTLPATFTTTYYPTGMVQGITYYGSTLVTNVDWPANSANYSDDIRMIILQVRWTNADVPRLREMRTYVARNGMQPYIF
ncbi:MAG: hypothetical protein WCO56_14530 [Verrucomicrobiota bacterium]